MLPLHLLLFRLRSLGVNWWRVGGLAGGAALIALALYVRLQDIELGKDRVVYQNPRRVVQTRYIRVEGPVRTVTRVVETPGRKETTTEEVRAPVTIVSGTDTLQEPVLPPPARTSGWVLGAGLDGWTPYQTKDIGLYGGYRFFGRLDLLGRVSGQGKAGWVALWRF